MHAWPHGKFRARFYRNALPFESKNNPQPAVSGLTTYTWDAQDRLASVTLPDGSVHRYEYDYRTRRVGTSETPAAPGSATKSTAIVFSGGLSVAEWETTSSPSLASPPTVEYTRGPDMGGGVGGLLYTSRRDTNSPGLPVSSSPSLRYNLSNGRGDIVAQSDAYASLTWTASYEAYGKRTKETGTNLDKQRGNSKDEDPTGLLNEGFRYRDIETGVWLSRDPAGFVDGPNLYAYVQQNPWTAWDPLGLCEDDEIDSGSNRDAVIEMTGAPPVVHRGAASLFEGFFGGKTEVDNSDIQLQQLKNVRDGSGVGGVVGGVIRTASLRTIPFEQNPTMNSRMGGEMGAGLLPTLDAAERLVSGETVTGLPASRQQAAGELLLQASVAAVSITASAGFTAEANMLRVEARGLSQHGGVFTESVLENGSSLWTSTGGIAQKDFASLVNGGLYKGSGKVDIISGVHGLPDGSVRADLSLFQADVRAFGNIPGVQVHNMPELSPPQISDLIRNSNTTIGGFCNSESVLSPFK